MDALLAKAAEALPPSVIEALAAHLGVLAHAMAEEVARVLPRLAASIELETILREILELVFAAQRELRPLTAQEADRLNAIWGREIVEHGWTIDDVVELNRVVTLAGWEAALPLIAGVPEADRAGMGDLAAPLVRAIEASGPYIAGIHAAATERLAADRRERRWRFARAALTGARSEGDLRRQARELGLTLVPAYAVAVVLTRDDAAAHAHSVPVTRWEARLGDHALIAEVSGGLAVAIPLGDDGGEPERIRGLVALGVAAVGGEAVAGISDRVDGVVGLARGLREATATAELLARTKAPGSVAGFGDHLVDHILLGDVSLLRALVDRVLGPVLRERSADALVVTLEAYLACDGNASRVAAALDLHRHTVDYRINRLRDRLGRERPLTSVDLQMAVAGHRLLASLDAHAPPAGHR